MSQKVIEIVTENIRQQLEQGVKPWERPWYNGATLTQKNYKTGTTYSGINALNLLISQAGYKTGQWVTAKQAKDLGGHIRKGEKGTPVLWASPYCKDHGKAGCPEDCESASMAWRYYTVFNLDQTEGIEYSTEQPPIKSQVQRIAEAEAIIKGSKAIIKIGGTRAYYSPNHDYIGMPKEEAFKHTEGYYSTLLHELTHWTGHKSRMNRDFTGRFGDQAYAFEELIAELGSAFLCAHVGLPSVIPNHASYIKSWLKVIQKNPRALVEAASKASKAFEYLLGMAEPVSEPEPMPVKTKKPEPKPEPVPVSPQPEPLRAKHGIKKDERQRMLERLVLEYMSAPSQHELKGKQPEKVTIHYGSTTYNVVKTREAIAKMMTAMGYRKQLKALKAEGVA